MATMFPTQPADNFGSGIRTENPFSPGFVRQASTTPLAYQGTNQSRSAFARALSDQSASDIRNKFDLASQQYQQKAVEARAGDVQAQRANTVRQQGLAADKAVALRQQNTNYAQGRADLDAYLARAKQDYRVNTINNLVNGIIGMGLLSSALPSASTMEARLQAKYGGNNPFGDELSASGLINTSGTLGLPVIANGGVVGRYAPLMNSVGSRPLGRLAE